MPKLARTPRAETRRVCVNTRLQPHIREALIDAAETKGRTLSAEIEARLEASHETQQTPSFEDVRLMIREEIRAALRDGVICNAGARSSGFPLVKHDGGEMLAVDADGRVTWPERLRDARLCTPQTFGHSYDPIRSDGKLAYGGPVTV